MRIQAILVPILLVLMDILSITTATPVPETEIDIKTSTPNAVHLATSFISLSHALSSLRLTDCPLDAVPFFPFNQTTTTTTSVTARTNTTELTPPSTHLSLRFIALGRGTQNYTCPAARSHRRNESASATPVSTGAVATLYDVSCLAPTKHSQTGGGGGILLHTLPAFTHALPQEVLALYAVQLSRATIIGQHYFSAPAAAGSGSASISSSMPVFDLRAAQYGQRGGKFEGNWVQAKKVESVAAPGGSEDVPWLKLVGEGKEGGIKEIYRVHTAGGMSPATCAEHEGEFAVEYAAEYWFYG
ncbi:DUF3455 domain-containing protein [Aspergillus saccharolyticus JOP 1030-1]|uniref:Malate dehydrogenase n=1 Tax=Aspergillus saccharolyticus JOP 1030-1 TaxID=1450539 RepID=A0A319AC16_9EURO|nr:hypothetical protein BP01DRAFT_362173 [Aspergillus saccharolyticus JOP 1030-1]PYH49208.1 hypothetical protein BP01DRAFT_362173 [Aspergillus saccharolyticus JOP 1030-1]